MLFFHIAFMYSVRDISFVIMPILAVFVLKLQRIFLARRLLSYELFPMFNIVKIIWIFNNIRTVTKHWIDIYIAIF